MTKMKLATTYENGEIFQHFGRTEQFKVYEIVDKEIKSSEVVGNNGAGHGQLVTVLKDMGVETLICGGIGGGAKQMFAQAGIALYPGAMGNADDVVKAFVAGNLDYDPETCCDHHDHDHEEGHECTCGH